MPTPRNPTAPNAEAIDQFCAQFDDRVGRYEERLTVRHDLIGLLLRRGNSPENGTGHVPPESAGVC